MRLVPVNGGVQVDLSAPQASRFLDKPFHQACRVASLPKRGLRHQIIDIQVISQRQVVPGAKSGDRRRVCYPIFERSHQPKTFRTQILVHQPDECIA